MLEGDSGGWISLVEAPIKPEGDSGGWIWAVGVPLVPGDEIFFPGMEGNPEEPHIVISTPQEGVKPSAIVVRPIGYSAYDPRVRFTGPTRTLKGDEFVYRTRTMPDIAALLVLLSPYVE